MNYVIRNLNLGWYWSELYKKWGLKLHESSSYTHSEATRVAAIFNRSLLQDQRCEVITFDEAMTREVMES